jgi:hypothetical protein
MDDQYFEVEESTPLLPEQRAGDVPQIDLEPQGLLPRPPSRRKRVTQIGLVLVAIVAVALLLRDVIAPSGPVFPGRSAITLQTIVPAPSALITSNINFGTVSINGQRQRAALPMFFVPRSTIYRITIDAPPFQQVSCTMIFSIAGAREPDNNNPDCAIGSGAFSAITANGVTDTPMYLVEIDFSASDLPPDQQSQINTLLAPSVAKQQSTTVPAGSYIATRFNADNTITSRRVTTSLRATAFQAASTNFGPYGFSCAGLICRAGTSPERMSTFTGKDWLVAVPVALRWQFTTAAGRVVGDVSFPVAFEQEVLLAYSPDAGWSVSPQYVSGPLNAGDTIGNLDCQTGTMVAQEQVQIMNGGFSVDSGQSIEGCQVFLQDSAGTQRGAFIWRFGVLMAADDAAHRLVPGLPIAPKAEIKAVQGAA